MYHDSDTLHEENRPHYKQEDRNESISLVGKRTLSNLYFILSCLLCKSHKWQLYPKAQEKGEHNIGFDY